MNIYKIKRTNYYFFTILLIFFLCFFFIYKYNKGINNKIGEIAEVQIDNKLYNVINTSVNSLFVNNNVNDIINIYQNNEGEILYVDYDINTSYYLLNNLGMLINEDIKKIKNTFITIPIFIGYDNYFFSQIGPKVIIKTDFNNSAIMNIYTKITNYGINNALLEVYIKINIDLQIIVPFKKEKHVINYNTLIASKVINGKVPTIYGDYLSKESSLFSIPLS